MLWIRVQEELPLIWVRLQGPNGGYECVNLYHIASVLDIHNVPPTSKNSWGRVPVRVLIHWKSMQLKPFRCSLLSRFLLFNPRRTFCVPQKFKVISRCFICNLLKPSPTLTMVAGSMLLHGLKQQGILLSLLYPSFKGLFRWQLREKYSPTTC